MLEEYRCVRLLGAGGMGQVYLYQDTELDRMVAIKFLNRLEEGYGKRFRREALAAARIQHPNVVTIHRVGEVDGRPYLVYEYIRGASLEALPKPIPWRRAHEIGLDLARGLAAAHRCGVLHRDIKPGNAIVAGETGQAKLIDFGLAKLVATTGPMHVLGGEHARAQAAPGEAPAEGNAHEGSASSSLSDAVWGTLPYLAPEILGGEPGTQRSDVYALGVVLHELCTGRLPEASAGATAGAFADVEPGFAAIVHRCLSADPTVRYRDGDELRRALEALAAAERGIDIPVGNPYRGLLQFEARHRALFFGRGPDTHDVIERLCAQRFVLLSGESGVGKSSLARAGVLPLVEDGALAQGRTWSTAILEPGRWPLTALLHLLATRLGAHEDALRADVQEGDLAAVAARVRQRHGDEFGTVLYVDQLEELVTWSDPDEASATAELLAALSERVRGMRILATARADQLGRLAALPGLGEVLDRNLVLVRPLGKDAIRETILGPARLTGVRFESDALVDELVDAAASAEGGLPLLQFTLAELWNGRDVEQGVITHAAFERLGGVGGALAQHADRVIDGWEPGKVDAARRILLRLVTSHRTRARCTGEELVGGEPGRAEVLQKLVTGRLVVASTSGGQAVYTLAHEALLRSWSTLRHWLDEEEGVKAVLERLSLAVNEWERVGRADSALWGPAQLAEAQIVKAGELSEREAAFLAASRRAARRRTLRQRLIVMAVFLSVIGGVAAVRYREALRLEARIKLQVMAADEALHRAEARYQEFRQERERTMARLHEAPGIDVDERAEAEASWADALKHAFDAGIEYQHASLGLEVALNLDSTRDDVRLLLAQVLDAQAHLAEETGSDDLDTLLGRLKLYSAEASKRWDEPIPIEVETRPPGAHIAVERYRRDADGHLMTETDMLSGNSQGLFQKDLPPGSYALVVQGDETHGPVRYPLLVRRGQAPERVIIERPAKSRVPEGFVFVPAGRFLFGYGTNDTHEVLRRWYNTVPLHERETGSFLIAGHETTYGEWLEFLRACFPDRCPGIAANLPAIKAEMSGGVDIEMRLPAGENGRLFVDLHDGKQQVVQLGQPIIYAERTREQEQPWEQVPVIGVSPSDVQGFLRWLRIRTRNRIPGARLCREDEWERAARGADARLFPHGKALRPEDANFDETYGRTSGAFGPDAVGTHPRSMSPLGLHDMAGNVWEITESIFDQAPHNDQRRNDDSASADEPRPLILRSGSYYQDANSSSAVNRSPIDWNQRDAKVGFRVCADLPR
jgi:formylglycine-generating enzyme required for sulfatase activity